jgi:hypothetical protein
MSSIKINMTNLDSINQNGQNPSSRKVAIIALFMTDKLLQYISTIIEPLIHDFETLYTSSLDRKNLSQELTAIKSAFDTLKLSSAEYSNEFEIIDQWIKDPHSKIQNSELIKLSIYYRNKFYSNINYAFNIIRNRQNDKLTDTQLNMKQAFNYNINRMPPIQQATVKLQYLTHIRKECAIKIQELFPSQSSYFSLINKKHQWITGKLQPNSIEMLKHEILKHSIILLTRHHPNCQVKDSMTLTPPSDVNDSASSLEFHSCHNDQSPESNSVRLNHDSDPSETFNSMSIIPIVSSNPINSNIKTRVKLQELTVQNFKSIWKSFIYENSPIDNFDLLSNVECRSILLFTSTPTQHLEIVPNKTKLTEPTDQILYALNAYYDSFELIEPNVSIKIN